MARFTPSHTRLVHSVVSGLTLSVKLSDSSRVSSVSSVSSTPVSVRVFKLCRRALAQATAQTHTAGARKHASCESVKHMTHDWQ